MSIRKAQVVDWLGIEKGTADVVLTLVDDEDWQTEQEHIELRGALREDLRKCFDER